MTKPSVKRKTLSKQHATDNLKKIQHFAHCERLWERGEKILVGISGGPDSVFLLSVLRQLSEKLNFSLHAVHINYRLRGPDSDEDERFVRALCKKWRIPLSVYTPKVRHTSEDALRTLRYARFESLRQKLEFSKIAVGHHQNDQAETLLLHLFRGCGTEGMAGMRPKNGTLIRPLLTLSRDEILASLKKNAIPFRKDKSNDTLDYTRNILRKKILPAIAKNVQPNIIALLAQSASLFADDAEIINTFLLDSSSESGSGTASVPNPFPERGQVLRKAPDPKKKYKIPFQKTKNSIQFSQKDFLALPFVLQKRVLKNLLFQVRKSQKDIDFGNIFELQKALASKKNKPQKISFLGLIYKRKGDTVTLRVARTVSKK